MHTQRPNLKMAESVPPSLMTLPPELRNRIYEDVFANQPVSIEYQEAHKDAPVTCNTKSVTPGILLASRKTYIEAIGIYYALSTFTFSEHHHFRSFRTLYTWLNSIPKQNVAVMTDVRYDATPRLTSREGPRMVNARYEEKNARDVMEWLRVNVRPSRLAVLGPEAIKVGVKTEGGIAWLTPARLIQMAKVRMYIAAA